MMFDMTTTAAPEHSADLDLLPQAQALAAELGAVPSRNRLIKELRVGAPKANAVLSALRASFAAASPRQDRPRVRHIPRGWRRPAVRLASHARPAPLPTAPEPLPEPRSQPVAVALPAPRRWSTRSPGRAVSTSRDTATHLGTQTATAPARTVRAWPVLLLALPAFVAIWSGWVGLGELTGFGIVHPLPGIWDGLSINSAITLPVGVETYAAFALRVWLSGVVPARARKFARTSAIGSLVLGAAGQVAYHLLVEARVVTAPTAVTVLVACLPVAVLGMGAALAHLMRGDD